VNAQPKPDSGAPGPSAESGPGGHDGHVGIELLRAYREHRLSAEEETRIGEHLLNCPECRELAVDVSAFFDPPEAGEKEPRVDSAATWEGVRASLETEGWFAEQRARQLRRAMRSGLIAAACLVLAIVGLSRYRMFGAQEQILVSIGAFMGSPDEIVPVRLPALLKLNVAATEGSLIYRAVLSAADGRVARSFSNLRLDPQGRLEVPLRRWTLDPGLYHFAVRPEGGEADGPIDEYQFRVVAR
jgi:hypothetical protein